MANQLPITTIPPFTNAAVLPACATACIPLYDVNGGCVPPAAPTAAASVYDACFCKDARVSPFSTTVNGVCDAACPDPAGLTSIQKWFQGLCSVKANAANPNGPNTNTNNALTTTTTAVNGDSGTGGSSGTTSKVNNGGGGDWISNHWQWVIFIVVFIVGVTAIWVGACIWRRRYTRKRERRSMIGSATGNIHPSGSTPSWGGAAPPPASPNMAAVDQSERGAFMPGPVAAEPLGEKPVKSKKKWLVKERT